jgi:hypothetical protein
MDNIVQLIKNNPNFVAFNYKFIISLGHGCQPAIHLKRNGLKQASLPLDSISNRQSALISLFETHFDKFMDKNYLEAREHRAPYHEKIVNTFYNLTFFHDFSVGGLSTELSAVNEKYTRRIKRLYSILASEGPVLFIRTQLDEQNAQQLTQILTTQFPNLRYTLLVINRETEELTEWNIPNTIKINTSYAEDTYAMNPAFDPLWQSIFSCFSYELEGLPSTKGAVTL